MSRSDDRIRFDSDDLNLINMFSFTCRIVRQETNWERGANSDRALFSACQATEDEEVDCVKSFVKFIDPWYTTVPSEIVIHQSYDRFYSNKY